MRLFYTDRIDYGIVTLNEEESRHCVKVMRLRPGDAIDVTDGQGTLYRCRLIDANARECTAAVEDSIHAPNRAPFKLHIAVAPTKNPARMEWLVEKAVEIGVDEITPIVCEHSERSVMKTERLGKVAVSAMKQSLHTHLPVINEPVALTDLTEKAFAGQRFVAHCDGDYRTPLREAYTPGQDATVLIGPEGGFSDNEIKKALSAGYVPVTMGESRLRTETAALAAVALINLLN